MEKALVIFSGGQDSTTCLGWALREFDSVECITFYYEQRHDVEIACASIIIKKLNEREGLDIKHHIVDVSMIKQVSIGALIDANMLIGSQHPMKPNLPASYIPNRNALFITLAHALAQKIGAQHLVGGMNAVDYSGYPDCRRAFLDQFNDALNIGSECEIQLHTPLINLTKGQIFYMSKKLDVLEYVINYSHSCYEGNRSHYFIWGVGCGECPACKIRIEGHKEFTQILQDEIKLILKDKWFDQLDTDAFGNCYSDADSGL